MSVALYPPAPAHVDKSVTEPSASFKKEVFRVLLAIFFFIFVYILMVALAIGLAALCALGGIALIALKPMVITLMLGIGMAGLGVLVVVFLFKFLFAKTKIDRSGLTEITKEDQPALFAFVKQLTTETKTPFPKKIYVSSDVNASVFYDSSLWSMVFPIKKNLQIGLGLVNSVNLSEFKAILAHEFGHFSQRSMKLGSYVYNVNRVIYNMLYDNAKYGDTLQGFANASGYFALFANITAWIIGGIQWVLRQVYGIVNKTYMGLSRQMEFHADSVAASVSGSAHLVTSLRRLEVAENAYQTLINQYQDWIKQNQKPDNLYPQHRFVMRHLAELYDIPLNHDLPQVDAKTFARFNNSRVVVKDQWASHPSTDDRENHLNSLNLKTEVVHASAWTVFENPESLQQKITQKLFAEVKYQTTPETLTAEIFERQYNEQSLKYRLNDRYKGYFNNRSFSEMEYDQLPQIEGETFDSILTDEAANLPQKIYGLNSDLEVTQLINNGSIRVRNFDFAGQKYRSNDTPVLIQQLTNELEAAKNQLRETDKRLVAFFVKAADAHGQKEILLSRYRELQSLTDQSIKDLEHFHQLMQVIQPIFHELLQFDKIHQIMHAVKLHEVPIKDRMKQLIEDPAYQVYLTEKDKALIREYIGHDYKYFYEPDFNNEALGKMMEATSVYNDIINERVFAVKKSLLEDQLQYIAS
ncbi:MAG TPA: M48 family metalloprotease [Cyclobacteriaceae bacterium]|nr:M48 family metalloprotease [Cyclobacteriaceae bacterium]HMV08262.1 M48 family metalloprotease [Cyclobacteriaceae bacterium]HMV90266.1 M48 family metalloprotease [Cyclobacteriaceae bacterium]HMX02105.1 M48 family metalloprotease [Cyclobacteriaceae bacterium]HMX49919.1 M48 family metalloprotease [Cyclobacteriaceae bacterium]